MTEGSMLSEVEVILAVQGTCAEEETLLGEGTHAVEEETLAEEVTLVEEENLKGIIQAIVCRKMI